MKRDYTSRFYTELIEDVARTVPGTALGADVMIGFPGEGDGEFNNTVRLIENSPLPISMYSVIHRALERPLRQCRNRRLNR